MAWCTIESDPGVFTEMLSHLGVKDMSVEEIYSLDQGELFATEPSFGLIFLFKYVAGEIDQRPIADVPELYFARQMVENACATQAILAVLFNASGVELGPDLSELKSFSLALDPESRGYAIGNCDKIRDVHNGFARAEPFLVDDSARVFARAKEDVFHFIAYVPFLGHVYEIDGLKPGPIDLGSFTTNWLSVCQPAIEQRMQRYAQSETSFALLTLRPRRSAQLEQDIAQLQATLDALTLQGVTDTPDVESLRLQMVALQEKLEQELANQERQRQENIRRRHNYVPFVLALMKHLAHKGHLPDMINHAKRRLDNSSTIGRKRK